MSDGVRIISAAKAGPLSRLESLACRVFGDGDRPPGWFARKLRRECVNAALSRLAVTAQGADDEPAAWQGYVLIGAPPSVSPRLRTSGTGVIPEARERGVGGRLVEAACEIASAAGAPALQVPAEASAEAYYARLGFDGVERLATLLSFGRGCAAALEFGSPRPWTPVGFDLDRTHVAVGGYLAEVWALTDDGARTTIEFGTDGLAHASREGVAVVLHRALFRKGCDAAARIDSIRSRLRSGVPLLLTGVNTTGAVESAIMRSLLRRGWSIAQRSVLMERTLAGFTASRHA